MSSQVLLTLYYMYASCSHGSEAIYLPRKAVRKIELSHTSPNRPVKKSACLGRFYGRFPLQFKALLRTADEVAILRSKDVQHALIWTTLTPEDAVPSDHPLRPMRTMVNAILADLSPEFSKLYARRGRPSIAPEKLLRALLLQVFFLDSERADADRAIAI